MAEDRVKRKDLWNSIGNIKKLDVWLDAGRELKLKITQAKGGTSHYSIRFANYEATDIRGLVATVYAHGKMRQDVNEKIFKKFLDKGFEEDDIWRALRMLK